MRHANSVAIICSLLLPVFVSNGQSSQGSKSALRTLLSQRVKNYDDTGHDFSTTIDHLSQDYNVPVGVDLDTLSDQHSISIHISRGTVADVLNAIVAQEHGFKWVEVNGVVNIGPQRNTNSILNLRIPHFSLTRARFDEIDAAIVSLPEVKKWLEDNDVTESHTMGMIGAVSPGKPFKPLVSLDLQDTTLREIMNKIIKFPGYRSWMIGRWGEKNQYLSIAVD